MPFEGKAIKMKIHLELIELDKLNTFTSHDSFKLLNKNTQQLIELADMEPLNLTSIKFAL